MRKAPGEDITVRIPVPRLRSGVIDDSVENQILPPVNKDLDRMLHRADEEDTRRIRKV